MGGGGLREWEGRFRGKGAWLGLDYFFFHLFSESLDSDWYPSPFQGLAGEEGECEVLSELVCRPAWEIGAPTPARPGSCTPFLMPPLSPCTSSWLHQVQ